MENWLTAQQIAEFSLNSLPNTKAGVIYRAKKENWKNRKRSGKGGGLEYAFAGLPANVQAEIELKQYKALMRVDKQTRAEKRALREAEIAQRDINQLTAKQRDTADARLLMALLVKQYEVELGRTAAINYVSGLSRKNALPVDGGTDYNKVCANALAKTHPRAGVGTRKLHEWCINADKCNSAEERLKAFAPQQQGQPEKELVSMAWLPDFMAVYRNSNGVCVARAYREFAKVYAEKQGADAVPHEHTVYRALGKMPRYVRETGRITGAALKQLKTYVKRDTSKLCNNDVWVGDGHSFKIKVQHPDSGRPFTPELTVIMDIASRYIVGWSLSYSESQLAVADALRHGMVNHGIPAIYYSDNGGGQTNRTFDADLTGILPRLGILHETGIPGNPNGRGIIERFMKEAPNLAAQQFATYYGAGADKETTRKTLVAVDSLAKAQLAGKTADELTPKQRWAQGKLPHWDDAFAMIEAAIDWHNTKHKHRALHGATPAMRRHTLSQGNDVPEVVMLSEVEAKAMYRPAYKRKVQRAWIQLRNGWYWHKKLEALDGQEVMVLTDQHDVSSVIVRDLQEKYICEAQLDGNTRDFFPMSIVEEQREKRAKTRTKLLDDKHAQVQAERQPAIEHEKLQTLHELASGKQATVPKKEYVLFASDLEDEAQRKVG